VSTWCANSELESCQQGWTVKGGCCNNCVGAGCPEMLDVVSVASAHLQRPLRMLHLCIPNVSVQKCRMPGWHCDSAQFVRKACVREYGQVVSVAGFGRGKLVCVWIQLATGATCA
jgi:hypothetical protein